MVKIVIFIYTKVISSFFNDGKASATGLQETYSKHLHSFFFDKLSPTCITLEKLLKQEWTYSHCLLHCSHAPPQATPPAGLIPAHATPLCRPPASHGTWKWQVMKT